MNKLLFATIGFFLLINTQYFWTPWLGVFEIFAVLIVLGLLLAMIVLLVYQFIIAIKEKFKIKRRNLVITCLVLVIITTIYRPFGMIDFDRLQGADKFVAEREGAANCTTILKLKDGSKFIENSYCFGTKRVKGTYHVANDTIWFSEAPSYYKFGVLVQKFDKNCIELYKNKADKQPQCLVVTKNDL